MKDILKNKINSKIKSEKDSRASILNYAKFYGVEKDVKIIFEKYDKLLAKCTNESERQHIGKLGILELHNFLKTNFIGTLEINGETVAKGI